MSKLPNYVNKTIKTWIYITFVSLIILIVSLFTGDIKENVIGFILGGITSLLTYSMIVKMVGAIGTESSGYSKAVSNAFIRYFIYIGIVFASYITDLNYFLTIFGLFSVKLIILIDIFILKEE